MGENRDDWDWSPFSDVDGYSPPFVVEDYDPDLPPLEENYVPLPLAEPSVGEARSCPLADARCPLRQR